MKLSEFDIDFIKFKNEKDTFTLKLKDTFFGLKENSLYDSCDIAVSVECERKESTLKLDFLINGYVLTTCDRCLKEIKLEVKVEYQEVLKLTGNTDLLIEENYISINHQIYSTYDTIYEQICLHVPARRICKNSVTKNKCELNYQSSEEETPTDHRWDELKKLIK